MAMLLLVVVELKYMENHLHMVVPMRPEDACHLLFLQRKRILRPTSLLKNQTLQKRNQVLAQTKNPIQILSHLNQQKNLKNY